MGADEPRLAGRGEAPVKYHSGQILRLTATVDVAGPRQGGSLTGAVASQRVTEAPKGSLSADGHRAGRARAQGSLTVRPTGRADGKPGPSDPTAPCGRAVDYRITATPGITG